MKQNETPNPADFMQLGEKAFEENVHEKLRETLSPNEKQMWISVEQAGQAYSKWYYEDCVTNKNYKPKPLTRGEFIEKLKFDDDFYKKWGQPYIADLEAIEYFKTFKTNKI